MDSQVEHVMRRSRAAAGGVGLLTLIVVLSGCPNFVTNEEGGQAAPPEPDSPAEAVTFTPDPGVHTTDTSVDFETATSGATIDYTVDGTETTIMAVTVAKGYAPSKLRAATHSIDNRGDGSPPNSNRYEPVTMVSWYDAVTWTNAYSEMAGLEPVYHLPNGEPVKSSVSTDPNYADDLDN